MLSLSGYPVYTLPMSILASMPRAINPKNILESAPMKTTSAPKDDIAEGRKEVVYLPSIPSRLISAISNHEPEFTSLPESHKYKLALMLWMCTDPRRRHSRYPSMFSFTTTAIRAIWGSDELMRQVVCWKHFTVLSGSNMVGVENGYSHAYSPSPRLGKALALCLADEEPDKLITLSGRAWEPPRRAIATMAGGEGNRHTKWKQMHPSVWIPVSVECLQELRDNHLTLLPEFLDEEHVKNTIHRRVRAIDGLIHESRNRYQTGCVAIRYSEASTGRLFASGLNLQSVPRCVRAAALSGRKDYDISTCQWTILAQMAHASGVHCDLIDDYIENKKRVRTSISEGAGISLTHAKTCLTMLLFGAPLQQSEKAIKWHPGSFEEEIGPDRTFRLCNLDEFVSLSEELHRVGAAVLSKQPRLPNGYFTNALRLRISPKEPDGTPRPNRELLAHLLQGAEAQALMAVVEQEQQNILLCMHDGWVARDPLDVAQLTALIETKTGFRFVIEEETLGVASLAEINCDLEGLIASSQEKPVKARRRTVSKRSTAGRGRVSREQAAAAGGNRDPSAIIWGSESDPAIPQVGGLILTDRTYWNLHPRSTSIGPQRRSRAGDPTSSGEDCV